MTFRSRSRPASWLATSGQTARANRPRSRCRPVSSYPSSGDVSVAGLTPHRERARNGKQIGVIFGQRSQLLWDLPPRDSFDLMRRMYAVRPERYQANRVSALHGIGLADEYPSLPNLRDIASLAEPDARIEADMTLCVESYIGAEGGSEGVKLEQQVVITPEGTQLISTFPFEDELIG